MPATLEQDHSLVISGASWALYWQLREDIDDRRQIVYDGERIEVMPTPISYEHDETKTLLARLVELYAALEDVPLRGIGSVTLAGELINRGCESDEAYYVGDAESQPPANIGLFDPAIHQPPDLVIEIDVTSRSVSKDPVYAALGVVEVWRWRDGDLMVYHLTDGRYELRDDSDLLSDLSMHDLADHVRLGRRLSQPDVVRAWRKHLGHG
ncbi:MAG: Uma2 family endonuclease [Planctomycetota bacterium]